MRPVRARKEYIIANVPVVGLLFLPFSDYSHLCVSPPSLADDKKIPVAP